MTTFRIGIDENGLGARLGPMIATGVLAEVDERGARLLGRKLPARLRSDLDDSKRLVSCHDVSLGEAWVRALVPDAQNPEEAFSAISLESATDLRSPCPKAAKPQCWTTRGEAFTADKETVGRIRGHVEYLKSRGVDLRSTHTTALCVRRLNELKSQGVNRFVADLHAMERLVLRFREEAGSEVQAICGKVGGIGEYSKFFGPLGGRLHNTLEEGRGASAYRFPELGELHFVRDADAKHPLVMIASLVGKYVRELLMRRIAIFYAGSDAQGLPSGYHDPVTSRFFEETEGKRQKRRIPLACFERQIDGTRTSRTVPPASDVTPGGPTAQAPRQHSKRVEPSTRQTSLFEVGGSDDAGT